MFHIKKLFTPAVSIVIILTLIVGLKAIEPATSAKPLAPNSPQAPLALTALELYPADKEIVLSIPEEKTETKEEPFVPTTANPAATERTTAATTPSRSRLTTPPISTATTSPAATAKTTATTSPAATAKTTAPTTPQAASPSAPAPAATSQPIDNNQATVVINTAKQYLGVPYQWGGTTPSGFDCSGYMRFVYAKHGITLPRVSRDQYTVGKAVSMDNLRSGDLVFFSLDGDKVIDHVGMFLGGGQFIHASSKGVKITNLSPYWKNHYIGAKRVL